MVRSQVVCRPDGPNRELTALSGKLSLGCSYNSKRARKRH